jgi:4-hydroxybenzoyl-CoA thioesterase
MRNKKIIAPAHVCYKTSIDVQIGDINYGGHVGNERYLLFAQETRLRFLRAIGHSEVHFGEFGLVLTESHVEYFNELFHGDSLEITLALTTPSGPHLTVIIPSPSPEIIRPLLPQL